MPQRIRSIFSCITVFSLITLGAFSAGAQPITDPDSLSKNAFQWNQQEKELGFLHMDQVYPARKVPAGPIIHPLPWGKPLYSFRKGGEKENLLKTYMKEQKVAGLLVLVDGKVRLEKYALGLSDTGRWTSQSVAKSVTSTLVGAAIKDGYIRSVEDYVADYIPDLKGSAYDSVKIRHLLTMTTGVRWNEHYDDTASDIVHFYIDPVDSGVNATVSYMRRLPAEAAPGKKWVYKTGETNLLGVLVSSATGKTLADYLSEKIWKPYGMQQPASWLIDRSEHELGGCCLQVTLRDYARFGQFILNGAEINGKSIVPDGWLAEATKAQVPLWPGGGYGYQWWVFNKNVEALGIYGQCIHIDPEHRMVVVVSSAWPEAESNERHAAASRFFAELARELDKEKNTPPLP